MNIKKHANLIMLFLVAVIVTVPISIISAYFVDSDSVTNTSTIGGNNISIIEEFEPEPMVPGKVISKKVQVYNEGPNGCYVRVRVVFSDSNMGQYAKVDWNLDDWVYDATDEYYYYKLPLDMNETTTQLMSSIQIDLNTPENEIRDVDVIVYAESYQADGFNTYQEAWSDYEKNLS